jgi:tellurite resistance protein TerC
VIDLVAHRGDHGAGARSALIWSIVWVGLGLGFGLVVWLELGPAGAVDYYAAYLIEKSLSVDNLFVFLVIFSALKVPTRFQRRVLWWGILGAVVFRAAFIFAGASAVDRWSWVTYVFAALLLFTAVRTFFASPSIDEESRVVTWLSRHLPVSQDRTSGRFITRERGRLMVTPLLVALLALESTDILFAVDSVPAAFAVTHDRYILYSSNVMAILGLRALYLVLAEYLPRLVYLHYGLAVILGIAAIKIAISGWMHIPAWVAIGATLLVVGISIGASLRAAPAGDAGGS